jgi:hypothetical protein
MSYHCPECDERWSAYQVKNGACPACGCGTKRVRMVPTVTVDAYKALVMDREELARMDRVIDAFEEFLLAREALNPKVIAERLMLEQWLALPCAPDGPTR